MPGVAVHRADQGLVAFGLQFARNLRQQRLAGRGTVAAKATDTGGAPVLPRGGIAEQQAGSACNAAFGGIMCHVVGALDASLARNRASGTARDRPITRAER